MNVTNSQEIRKIYKPAIINTISSLQTVTIFPGDPCGC